MSLPPVVALSGYAHSGKSSVAEILQGEYGYRRASFAQPVKELALYLGWDGEKDDDGRKLLQELGHGARQVLGDDVWTTAALRRIPANTPVVFDDVRYANEVDTVRLLGGVVVRVVRPGVVPARGHVTETSLDHYAGFDAAIDNSGSLADLARATRQMMARLSGLAEVVPIKRGVRL